MPSKYEALKRKRRRNKLKAKENEIIIEKFSAQSSKNAKYAKSVIKKREISELRPEAASNVDAASKKWLQVERLSRKFSTKNKQFP